MVATVNGAPDASGVNVKPSGTWDEYVASLKADNSMVGWPTKLVMLADALSSNSARFRQAAAHVANKVPTTTEYTGHRDMYVGQPLLWEGITLYRDMGTIASPVTLAVIKLFCMAVAARGDTNHAPSISKAAKAAFGQSSDTTQAAIVDGLKMLVSLLTSRTTVKSPGTTADSTMRVGLRWYLSHHAAFSGSALITWEGMGDSAPILMLA